jgi:putative SOS response-associated peptidase YedK
MCGRYLRRSDKQRIAEAFKVAKGLADLVLPPWDYNVAPASFQPVIRLAVDSARDIGDGCSREPARELTLMRWGLVPYFAKDLKSFGYSTINARAESVATSPTFSAAFERRRCLVPADGFYEWKLLPAQTLFGPDPTAKPAKKKAATAEKQPYVYTLANGRPFAFAGLWDVWKDPTGGALESFSIVTTTPNELTAEVHDRMPVILRPQDYDLWLARDPAMTPKLELLSLLRPYPAEQMQAREAHPDVGNVRNNHPGLLDSA